MGGQAYVILIGITSTGKHVPIRVDSDGKMVTF